VDAHIQFEEMTRSRRRFALRSALGLVLLLGIPLAGQSPFPQFPSGNSGKYGPHDTVQVNPESSPDQKRLRLLNAERQKSIVSDTEKLLKLARELNDQVAASDSASMTDEELRKVAEIAKLARSVKEKMSFSMGGFPSVNSPIPVNPVIQ
jgi:hypothetical protein